MRQRGKKGKVERRLDALIPCGSNNLRLICKIPWGKVCTIRKRKENVLIVQYSR